MRFLKALEVGLGWWEETKRRWSRVYALYDFSGSRCPRIHGRCLTQSMDRNMAMFGPSILYQIGDMFGLVESDEQKFLGAMIQGQLAYDLAQEGMRFAAMRVAPRCGDVPGRCATGMVSYGPRP
jgi:hypothetical protein